MIHPAAWLTYITLLAAAPTPEQATFGKYCVGCHNSKTKTSGLELDALTTEPVGQHPEAWEKVARRLRARYMPPPGLPRPDE